MFGPFEVAVRCGLQSGAHRRDLSLLDFALVQGIECVSSVCRRRGCLRVNYSAEMLLIECAEHQHLIAIRLPACEQSNNFETSWRSQTAIDLRAQCCQLLYENIKRCYSSRSFAFLCYHSVQKLFLSQIWQNDVISTPMCDLFLWWYKLSLGVGRRKG